MSENSEQLRLPLNEPEISREVSGVACVAALTPGETKAGKPYATVVLRNALGQASGKIWAEALPQWADTREGDGVEVVRGRWKAGWNGASPELAIEEIRRLDGTHWVRAELNRLCPVDASALEHRWSRLVEQISRKGMHALLAVVLARAGGDKFKEAPAATAHHHAYIGGLYEHSIEVAEIALTLARTPAYAPLVDTDAIIVGSLLHDVGKLREYAWRGVPIALSAAGRARYHTTTGAELVGILWEACWEQLTEFGLREVDRDHVQHVIESHHGEPQYGSPTPPRTLEATIVHMADRTSAALRKQADILIAGVDIGEGWMTSPAWKREAAWTLRPDELARHRAERRQGRSGPP